VFIFAPLGVYIQYLDEAQGATRSFTIATMIDAALAMITTGCAPSSIRREGRFCLFRMK
jgi:hypothetical protein